MKERREFKPRFTQAILPPLSPRILNLISLNTLLILSVGLEGNKIKKKLIKGQMTIPNDLQNSSDQ